MGDICVIFYLALSYTLNLPKSALAITLDNIGGEK